MPPRWCTPSRLAERIRRELAAGLTGPAAPYNRTFTSNGIACTTVSAIAAVLGIENLGEIGEPQIEQIKRLHLLLAMFNAWQPGVLALSGWDLVGMLTLPVQEVSDLTRQGDTRWINRGAHDLRGVAPGATRSQGGLPVGRALYGPLAEQLADPVRLPPACGRSSMCAGVTRSPAPVSSRSRMSRIRPYSR